MAQNKITGSVKKGEGSRGGKIIGRTKSGAPIYASSRDNPSGTSRGSMIKGSAYVAGGIGVGAFTGHKAAGMYGDVMKHSLNANKYKRVAKGLEAQADSAIKKAAGVGPLWEHAAKEAKKDSKAIKYFVREAKQFRNLSKSTVKGAIRLKTGGSLFAGALVGIGINELTKDSKDFKDHEALRMAAVAAPAGIAAVASGAGFYRKISRVLKVKPPLSWMSAADHAFKNLLSMKK